MKNITRILLVLIALAAPTALAQNTTNDNDTGGNVPDVNVNLPPDEATGYPGGISGTTLVILIMLAVVVIALVIVVATRDRRDYP